MKKEISIVWFRQDLRISDNPTLVAAAKQGNILPIYIFDDCAPQSFKIGSSSKVWLYHSLLKLNESLNHNLNFYVGSAKKIIISLIKHYNVKNIFWNTCYEPWFQSQEHKIKKICRKNLIACEAFNSNYLWNPNDILKDDKNYYKVFTAYKNKSRFLTPRTIINKPKKMSLIKDSLNKINLSDLKLIPKNQWYKNIEKSWNIGETAAQKKLKLFIKNRLIGYKEGRNYPFKEQTSKLSPHLHFGEISPAKIWHTIHKCKSLSAHKTDKDNFLNELTWREFSCYLLYHFKTLYKNNFNKKFDHFKWKTNSTLLKSWRTGHTGYPFIDAGMRQLWQTGYMHNRVRMVVASFLIKNLNIHWHKGRDWFWDCLVDADLANNSASWQWVAGSGVDAAPYFRIFNPILQGKKFDGQGHYTKKFIPELKHIPNKYLFKPWTAPEHILQSAGIILGKTYPKPIVDFVVSRKHALIEYKKL